MIKRQFAIRLEEDLRHMFCMERLGDSQLFQSDYIINNLFLISVISLQKRRVSDDNIVEYIELFDNEIINYNKNEHDDNDVLTKMYNKYIELYK